MKFIIESPQWQTVMNNLICHRGLSLDPQLGASYSMEVEYIER